MLSRYRFLWKHSRATISIRCARLVSPTDSGESRRLLNKAPAVVERGVLFGRCASWKEMSRRRAALVGVWEDKSPSDRGVRARPNSSDTRRIKFSDVVLWVSARVVGCCVTFWVVCSFARVDCSVRFFAGARLRFFLENSQGPYLVDIFFCFFHFPFLDFLLLRVVSARGSPVIGSSGDVFLPRIGVVNKVAVRMIHYWRVVTTILLYYITSNFPLILAYKRKLLGKTPSAKWYVRVIALALDANRSRYGEVFSKR